MKKVIIALFILSSVSPAFAIDNDECGNNLTTATQWDASVESMQAAGDNYLVQADFGAQDGDCNYKLLVDSNCGRVIKWVERISRNGPFGDRCRSNGIHN